MDKDSSVFFYLPWSKWSRITDPYPDHIKGTHPYYWENLDLVVDLVLESKVL